jgi:hypothetical protein
MSGMECPSCGARFYSSAWQQMIDGGELCSCGERLREAAEPRVERGTQGSNLESPVLETGALAN